jgi:hypothetical protein
MWSKNHKSITQAEREHMARVKDSSCVCCDAPGPCDAHHIAQGLHYTTVSLCAECHRGPSGLHGTKALMRIRKMTEIDMLNETLKRICA